MFNRENVIDGRSRFNEAAGAGKSAPSLERRLGQTSRVPLEDRPTMALNLGRLAARIDSETPLAGAKRMVEGTGNEGLWPKRKRFIRLPNEVAPSVQDAGDYGSSGATFLQLARSASSLLATSQTEDALEREKERAIRMLLSGTSYLPSYVPLTNSDLTAKSLIDEYGSALAGAIKERTRISDLWAVLETTPFDLDARSVDDEVFPDNDYGDAAKFPQQLLTPIFRDHIVEAVFSPSELTGFGWDEPTLELGFIALPVTTSMFVLPANVGFLFHASREDEDGAMASEASVWLASIASKDGVLPDIPYDNSLGYGWKPIRLSVLRKVGITAARGDDGLPKIRLNLWGDDLVAAHNSRDITGDSEGEIITSGGRKSQLRFVDLYGSDYLYSVYSKPVSYKVEDDARVVGLLPSSWDHQSEYFGFSEGAWTDDPLSASLLLDARNKFSPTLPHCEPIGGPLRKNCLGAGLLNNALSAPDGHGVTDFLIAKTAMTADAGLQFHEAMVDRYREALRRI